MKSSRLVAIVTMLKYCYFHCFF